MIPNNGPRKPLICQLKVNLHYELKGKYKNDWTVSKKKQPKKKQVQQH